MNKNYLHRTLIFLLPKVYSVQAFIQYTVTTVTMKENFIPADILFDVLSNGHIFCVKPLNCIARGENAL